MKRYLSAMLIAVMCVFAAASLPSCKQRKEKAREASGKILTKRMWEPHLRKALISLIREYGEEGGYAVFDCDNTLVMNDVCLTTMAYQIENLRFHFTPEEAFGVLTKVIPNLDTTLTFPEGEGGKDLTARRLATDIAGDWDVLSKFVKKDSVSLADVRKRDEFLDLRAKLWALSLGVDNTFGPEAGLLFPAALYHGMNEGQLNQMISEYMTRSISENTLHKERWQSPDSSACVTVVRGLFVPPEIKALCTSLQKHGIDVYVCSASPSVVVKALVCNKTYGIGVPPSNVYAIDLLQDEEGMFIPEIAEDDYVTYGQGKVDCIREDIAPSYEGEDPLLVAGDSNGDYQMLTSFEDLKIGIIINCLRSGDIADLTKKALTQSKDASPRYYVQGRDPNVPSFVKGSSSQELVK